MPISAVRSPRPKTARLGARWPQAQSAQLGWQHPRFMAAMMTPMMKRGRASKELQDFMKAMDDGNVFARRPREDRVEHQVATAP